MAAERDSIVVVAAVVERGGRLLVTRRLKGTHLAGLWEFPGGKCEPGEAHEACLLRELEEELGVEAAVGPEMLVTEHAYPERTVRLHFRKCHISGEPRAMLGQQVKWIEKRDLAAEDFPAADRQLIRMLQDQG
jgi:mutator protein MutT